jgi:Zn ribbon nucleic-acid-binding protein
MTCFCGCETYEKDANSFKVGCVKCGHGPQNHDDEFRNISRKIN